MLKYPAISLFAVLVFSLLFAIGCEKNPTKPEPNPTDTDTSTSRCKYVCISFDDGWKDQFDAALPILLENDFKASFGIITDRIGMGSGIGERMSVGDLKVLSSYGMDIASHTINHLDLITLTEEQMREQIFGSKEHLEGLGFEGKSFITPYLSYNSLVSQLIEEAGYIAGRTGWGLSFDFKNHIGIQFDIPTKGINNEGIEEFKEIVNLAGGDTVVSITYHHILEEALISYSTSIANFTEQMRYLKEHDFTVILLPDLFDN